jgi:hypothetical protein
VALTELLQSAHVGGGEYLHSAKDLSVAIP